MDQRKIIGLVCAAAAAGLLVLAAFSHSWLIGEDPGFVEGDSITTSVGLRSVDICAEGGECVNVALDEWAKSPFAPKGLQRYITLGAISFVLSLVTVAMMLVLLGYGISGRTPRWPMHPGTIALLLSIGLLIIGVLTLALHPFKESGWGTGPGFMILAAGDVSALAAGLMLGVSAPPTEDDWFE